MAIDSEVDAGATLHTKANFYTDMHKIVGAAKAKKMKAQNKKEKKEKVAKTTAAHPTYHAMIVEAISSLKERRGSSQPAIAKYLNVKYKAVLPHNFKKILSVQLRNLSKKEKLSKVKNSYKLSESSKSADAKGKALKTKDDTKVSLKKAMELSTGVNLTKLNTKPKATKSVVAKTLPTKALPKKTATPKKVKTPKSLKLAKSAAKAPTSPAKSLSRGRMRLM